MKQRLSRRFGALLLIGLVLGMAGQPHAGTAMPGELDRRADGTAILNLVVPKVPKPAPDIRYVDDQEKSHLLSEHRGKLVIVHFWATWCMPCREELPTVATLYQALDATKIALLPISLDREGFAAIKPFYREHGLTALPAFVDQGLAAPMAFKLQGVPTTLFVDRDGKEIARVLGDRRWDQPDIIALVKRLAE
jgi:thiol-disulfide isomerase/thioredoxin